MPNNYQRIDKANEIFWQTLTDIQSQLKISDENIARVARLKSATLKRFRTKNIGIKLSNLYLIANELDLDPSKLFKGDVDIDVLKSHLKGQKELIPKKFFLCANSKAFTTKNIFEKISNYSNDLEQSILRSVQIKKLDILQDDLNTVSVELSADIIKSVSTIFSNEVFYEWGKTNAFSLKNGLFGKTLSRSKNVVELYEMWLNLNTHIEKNWYYKISQITSSTIMIDSFPTQEMEYFHKKIDYTNIHLLWFRAGFASALPNYIGLSDSKVNILKSVHSGDHFCRFEINIENIKPLSLVSTGPLSLASKRLH